MNILRTTETRRAKSTFYPTPESLAEELTAGYDWKTVQSVLEPSAGKGDLARKAGYRMYQKRMGYAPYDERSRKEAITSTDIDCIEIDPTLRAILEGQGFRVVHNDFLTFETQKRYDLILMNPPFDHGAEHLLKALELQSHGGKIACILNAETLRNPYTAARQRLVKELMAHGAEITYKERAFADAERRTNVDIAIIRVELPKVKRDSIMDEMRKAPTYKAQEIPSQYAEMVRYNQIDEWVNRYNFEVACGIRLIEEYRALEPFIVADPMEKYTHPILILKCLGDSGRDTSLTVNSYIRQTRGKYWRAIFQQKTFTEKLTGNLLQELYDNVRQLMDYDFSVYNILTLVIKMNAKVVGGIEDTIVELFDDWTRKSWNEDSPNRHYYDGWKTNDCFSVRKKVIIPFYDAYDSWDKRFRAYRVIQQFRDIEKVFDFLDSGRTTWAGSLDGALKKAEETGDTRNIDTKYFTATFYKKGTAHLVFKDNDLLEKFNLFAGQKKGWLPPCYGKKKYSDMTPSERHVVDSFQGRERYEQVMAHADYYLDQGGQGLLMLGDGGDLNGGQAVIDV